MARIRTIKPEFFTHYDLFALEAETGLPVRVAFAGLWTQADREGRFKWRAPELKIGCLPYDNVDFSRVLHALETRGFIRKYACDDELFGVIPGFKTHQVINNKEKASSLPEPLELLEIGRDDDACLTRAGKDQGERKGKERKGKEGDDSAEPFGSPPAVPVISIPTNRYNTAEEEYLVTQDQVNEWSLAYPAVDVMQKLREIRAWNLNNPSKRKTLGGMASHINKWLAKDQNRGGDNRGTYQQTPKLSTVERHQQQAAALFAAAEADEARQRAMAANDPVVWESVDDQPGRGSGGKW